MPQMTGKARKLRVVILGDRGIPARYGGYSTLVEQVAIDLVAHHDCEVTVYCRSQYYPDGAPSYRGVDLVYLPAYQHKYLESVLHTFMSTVHSLFKGFDVALMLDPANAPNVLPLRLARVPVALHTDGLGYRRKKWGSIAQAYYKFSERLSAWFSTVLIADSRAMRDYYLANYGVDSSFIPIGCESGSYAPVDCLERYGLTPRGYYLIVTRIEPDNNTDLLVEEYRRLRTDKPLIIVGSARYPSEFSRWLEAQQDDKVRMLGGVYEADVLNALYRHSYAYLHGHEVGGTNPSLLRAMAASACCVALDTVFSREVLGEHGLYFDRTPGAMAGVLQRLETDPAGAEAAGTALRERAFRAYDWQAVSTGYAEVFRAMAQGRDPGQVYRPEDFAQAPPPLAP